MNKRVLTVVVSAGILVSAFASINSGNTHPNTLDNPKGTQTPHVTNNGPATVPKAKPICDGTTITTDCVVDGVTYSSYVYHPAAAEVSHTESITTYEKNVTGYCTLCNDGTYSPSCATGRGTCSHHGGVAEWNAPEYTNAPVSTTKTVVDAPAQAAYYDKTAE